MQVKHKEWRYILRFNNAKNVKLHITSKGEIAASVPKRMSKTRAISIVNEMIDDNTEKINDIMNKKAIKRAEKNITLEQVYYLGEIYALQVLYLNGKDKPSLTFDNDNKIAYLCCSFPYDNMEKRAIFKKLYVDIAYKVLREVYDDVLTSLSDLKYSNWYVNNILYKPLIMDIKTVDSYYGKCWTKRRKIILNSRLLAFDIETIKYVIYHELSHLSEANHSKKFYECLSYFCPNYAEIRRNVRKSEIRKFAFNYDKNYE